MNPLQLFAILRARWLPVLIVFSAGLATSIIYAVTRPVFYSATASVILEVKADPVTSMLYGGGAPGTINTQLEVMRSERVAQRVVKNMKLTDMSDLRSQWTETTSGSGSFESWLAEHIGKGLAIQLANPGGTVVDIVYQAADPRFAAAMANGFVQAYLETSIELRIDPALQYNSFFETQVREARDTLEAAQQKLSKFQQERGLLVTDGKLDIESERLASLSDELLTIQSEGTTKRSRVAQASRDAGSMAEVMGSGLVAGLKTDLAKAESTLSELSAKFGDNHPSVTEARSRVADLRTRLNAETRNVTSSMASDVRVIASREGEIRSAMEAQRVRVLKLKEVKDEGDVLARDVENAKRTYDMVFNRFNQTSIESQNRLSAATVLNQAEVPNQPASAKTAKTILMGVMMSLMAALGIAFLIEYFDRRARTPEDMAVTLGLPVIGLMPRPTMGKTAKRKLALIQQRVISGRQLPPPPKNPS